jgi:hypothetical protein
MIRRLADGVGRILDGKGLRLDVVSFGRNEKERNSRPNIHSPSLVALVVSLPGSLAY